MDYRILGPLEVCAGDRRLELGGEKQRALLTMLLVHANEPVSLDTLMDGVWGEQLPPTAHKTLQGYISRLRKTLERGGPESGGSSNGVLVTRGHAYLLRVGPGELDLDRFRDLVEEGRKELAAGDADRAAGVLRVALGLWRGPPLADFAYEAFAQQPIAELEELRLGVIEERVEADLALGRHDQLVGELATLVARNPLRERLRTQLMLALYRCGRQAEALDVYQEFRRGLAEELGLDPSQRMQLLEMAILARDPSLEVLVASRPPAEPAGPDRPRTRERLGRRLAYGGAALIAAAVVATVLVSQGGAPTSLSTVAGDSVGAISPVRGAISADVPVGSSPSSVVAGEGSVWVTNYNDNTVSRIDPATHATQTIPVDSTPSGIAVGAGAVWVANNFTGTVSWINPTVNRVVKRIAVGNAPSGVAFGYGSVWVTNSSDGTVSRIDAVTGDVVKTIPLGGGATDVAAGYEAVWVSDESDGQVLRVDPQTDQVTPINVGTGPTAITVGYDSVWVANSLDGTVWRINPQTNQIEAVIPVGNGPDALAAGAGGVWVANEFGGTLARIDVARDSVARTITVGGRPRGVAVSDGLVWVGAQASDAGHRGGTLTVLTSTPFDTIDPALSGATSAPVLTLYLTNDGLTAFKRVGGTDSSEVVPDLALTLPRPTGGGRTYRFQLRPGIRYSNGQPVKPEDFLRAIERGFKMNSGFSPYQQYYESIVGGTDCVTRPAGCDLSHGIVADDRTDTVTFHLAHADPEFLERLALVWAVAVPAGAPNHDIGRHPLPATGPYEIASYSPARDVRLVRNPHFHEWSHAARPDGYPHQILWKIGASPSAAVTAVEEGRADYSLDAPPPDRLGEVQTRYTGQLHPNPADYTAALFLNTRVAPFNDIRVRRAVNYAIDRREVAGLIGLESQPTCQLLPPYVPGYERYCPYTLDPHPAGTWSGPDLPRARSLIAASRTRGKTITIWNEPIYGIDYTATGRYVVSLLDSLGYRAQLKTFAAGDIASYGRFWDPRTRGQAIFLTAASAYTAASEFVQFQFSCQFFPGSNASEFCSPRLDAAIRRAFAAEGVEGANTPAAAGLWASTDRQITDQAPLVPLVTPDELDFVSGRVGNYQYNSVQGALIDQMWVK